jgi:hypothetical protein
MTIAHAPDDVGKMRTTMTIVRGGDAIVMMTMTIDRVTELGATTTARKKITRMTFDGGERPETD